MPNHKRQLTLLTAPKKSDVLRSGSEIAIAGLDKVDLKNLIKAEYRLYQTEVKQLYTIGTTTPTIVADTKYTIKITTPVQEAGFDGIREAVYAHTTPSALSGSAATDRSDVYVALTKKINDDSKNFTIAIADVGGSGVSMTIEDDAGYYAARPAIRGGANGVYLPLGFIEATHLVLTTAHVYEFGEGTRMVKDVPVFGPVTGNLDSGELFGQKDAVAGQKYDAAILFYNDLGHAWNTTGQLALNPKVQVIWADNTAGSDYDAFVEEIEKTILYQQFKDDPRSMISFMESAPHYASKLGTLPTGTAGDENIITFGDASFDHHVLGTQTILYPPWTVAGLDLVQDLTANDGNEVSAPIETSSPIEYIAGKDEFSFRVTMKVGDITDLNPFAVGFRKKEAFQADYNDYDALAAFAIDSAADETGATKNIDIHTIIDGAATQTDDTTVDWADAESRTFELRVDKDGLVTFLIDDVDVSSVQTPAFSFTDDEIIIPFIFQIGEAGDSEITLEKFISIPAIKSRKY